MSAVADTQKLHLDIGDGMPRCGNRCKRRDLVELGWFQNVTDQPRCRTCVSLMDADHRPYDTPEEDR